MGRDKYVIDGKEYDECGFCRASCPSRDFFKEPDSGLPLKCDMCESDPPLSKPMCVQKCLNDVLIYEEREEEVEEEVSQEDMEIGLVSMIDKYGLQKRHEYCFSNISVQESLKRGPTNCRNNSREDSHEAGQVFVFGTIGNNRGSE